MRIRPGMYVMYGNYKCKVESVHSDYLELVVQENPHKVVSVPFDKINYVVESTTRHHNTKGMRMMYD